MRGLGVLGWVAGVAGKRGGRCTRDAWAAAAATPALTPSHTPPQPLTFSPALIPCTHPTLTPRGLQLRPHPVPIPHPEQPHRGLLPIHEVWPPRLAGLGGRAGRSADGDGERVVSAAAGGGGGGGATHSLGRSGAGQASCCWGGQRAAAAADCLQLAEPWVNPSLPPLPCRPPSLVLEPRNQPPSIAAPASARLLACLRCPAGIRALRTRCARTLGSSRMRRAASPPPATTSSCRAQVRQAGREAVTPWGCRSGGGGRIGS